MTTPEECELDLPALGPRSTCRAIAAHYRAGMLIHQIMWITGRPYGDVLDCLARAKVAVRSPRESAWLFQRISQGAW